MNTNKVCGPANQTEILLYCRMGEAVCAIQILEAALSALITIKKFPDATWAEASVALEKHRHYTLGKAVRLAAEENLVSVALQGDLHGFLKQRNWLIHHAMFEYKEDLADLIKMNEFLNRIKDIADYAPKFQRAIEMELIAFSQAQGKDMSKVLARMEAHDKNI